MQISWEKHSTSNDDYTGNNWKFLKSLIWINPENFLYRPVVKHMKIYVDDYQGKSRKYLLMISKKSGKYRLLIMAKSRKYLTCPYKRG